ncbi:hypothetical protein [Streptomyces sp. NPDC050504]|uniref:hypothetical protein n=1 Tax=Streptomyces sp. NPDC050504 TaxID=3365618 RepID=UPI003796B933
MPGKARDTGPPCRRPGVTAVGCHQAVLVVVTELERIIADPAGAAGAVWRRFGRERWQTLPGALDNPDGRRLHEVRREEAAGPLWVSSRESGCVSARGRAAWRDA